MKVRQNGWFWFGLCVAFCVLAGSFDAAAKKADKAKDESASKKATSKEKKEAAKAPPKRREPEAKKYSLKELLAMAWKRSPMLKAAEHKLNAMRARQQEAFWASWWPQGTLVALVAPLPEARGNSVTSTTPVTQSFLNLSGYGVWTRTEVQAIWPLYTFGKLSLLQQAAGQGVRVGQANVSLEKSKLTVMVQKVFYGLQLAESSLVLLDEAEEYLADARKRVKGKTDKLKLAVFEAELKTRKLQAETGKRLALSGLSRLVGVPVLPGVKLKEPELDDISLEVRTLKQYQALAKKHRPELILLEHAVKAKRALWQVQQRMWTPDFFIGGFFRFSYSNAADDQLSPFARDDYNFLEGGLGLGLRFTIDVPIKVARARRAEAEFSAFRSQRKLAVLAIRMDVERRFRELKAAQKLVEIQKAGRKAANQWITRTMLAYNSGLVELREVTDALLAVAKARFGYLDALHKLNLAVAELSRSVGIDVASLKKAKAKGEKKP